MAARRQDDEPRSVPPVLVIVYFHKAIRIELERIHCAALSEEDFGFLVDRYHFLREVYEHHSQAEDEVILPALDGRVKNVARSYSLEHEVENDLFNEISQLLRCTDPITQTNCFWKEIICCTEAIQTTLCQHLFKEENQVLPLLMQYFSFEEQANLVWQFMGNIPVQLMEIFLPWLASCLSEEEREQMVACIRDIVPAEDLLQQVFSEWLKQDTRISSDRGLKPDVETNDWQQMKLEDVAGPFIALHHWHKAIKGELHQIANAVRNYESQESSSSALKSLSERMEFLSKVWTFHSVAEDRFVFAAIGNDINHTLLDQPCNEALQALKESIDSAGKKIMTQAEMVLEVVEKHFLREETELLPLASKLFTVEEQRNIVYESLRSMPLTFLRRVLPWLVAVVTDKEAKDMLLNIKLAAPRRDNTLVALLTRWACEKHLHVLELLKSDGFSRGKRSYQIEEDRPRKHYRSEGSPPLAKPNSRYYFGHYSEQARGISINSGKHRCKPIDQIFQFHKAIKKDLEYLDTESARLINCADEFFGQFSGRFYFLWGLYRAHSTAEDTIVFPALESKEALHNVSHSYMIDHRQEEDLFNNIASVLSEFSTLLFNRGTEGDTHQSFAAKLQRMCKSVRICLEKHLDKEESELWPLFDTHFTIEEQEKVMARIIGSTGAEAIQAMLPWVTSALTQQEQEAMLETWQQATRNTMFQNWLNAWWKNAPSTIFNTNATTSSSSKSTEDMEELARELADYLSNDKDTKQQMTTCDVVEDFKLECSSPEETENKTFKPGWPEIFRLNQEELEAAVRKVSRDTSLDPRRKAYLMQNLMTSRWMAAQQRMLNQNISQSERSPSFADEENGIFGCKHYRRNCKLRSACCGYLFTCRFCHDEASDHTMDRYQTKEMMCMKCLQLQPVGPKCMTPSCNGYSMASYYCDICKFFNNDDRKIYHCPFCNLCRVGTGLGIDHFHCLTCNGCMAKSLEENHVCREKIVETNCPICCDCIFGSVSEVRALKCGHFMHTACYAAYTSSHYTCPICCKTIGDMSIYFQMLDALLAAEQLPEEYRDRQQAIFCNDCESKGESNFHWVYHKCSACGSYNTKTI